MKRQLTDIAVKNAKPYLDKKVIKLSDGGGLYLLVNQVGKYWRSVHDIFYIPSIE